MHVAQRGSKRQLIFFESADYEAYLGWLREASTRWACRVHAYVLMTNHVHLLMTPDDADSVSRAMQYLGRRYVPYVNRSYQRSGTLWEGRLKSGLVQTEAYPPRCYGCIECNPVRAGMVEAPGQYPWSSYVHNAWGAANPLISEHVEDHRLGAGDAERQPPRLCVMDGSIES